MIIITDNLLKKGTRWTKQIKVVIDIVYESDRPLSADEIYRKARRKMPNISLGTVYRNLNKLVDEGLVSETQNNGIATFCRHPFPNATIRMRTLPSTDQRAGGAEHPGPVPPIRFQGGEMVAPSERDVQGV